jgi:hypothetical protein
MRRQVPVVIDEESLTTGRVFGVSGKFGHVAMCLLSLGRIWNVLCLVILVR